jgi:hypothetical protein
VPYRSKHDGVMLGCVQNLYFLYSSVLKRPRCRLIFSKRLHFQMIPKLCTRAATTATRPCCWARHATSPRLETSMAPYTSYFSLYVFKNIWACRVSAPTSLRRCARKDIHHRCLSALPGLSSLWRRQSILMRDASLPRRLKEPSATNPFQGLREFIRLMVVKAGSDGVSSRSVVSQICGPGLSASLDGQHSICSAPHIGESHITARRGRHRRRESHASRWLIRALPV